MGGIKLIYVKLNSDSHIESIHYMPFDETHGLGKTKEELESEGGIFVESVPEPENRPGKSATLKFSETDGLYYEYIDRPPTPEEVASQQMDYLVDLDFRLLQIELGF